MRLILNEDNPALWALIQWAHDPDTPRGTAARLENYLRQARGWTINSQAIRHLDAAIARSEALTQLRKEQAA